MSRVVGVDHCQVEAVCDGGAGCGPIVSGSDHDGVNAHVAIDRSSGKNAGRAHRQSAGHSCGCVGYAVARVYISKAARDIEAVCCIFIGTRICNRRSDCRSVVCTGYCDHDVHCVGVGPIGHGQGERVRTRSVVSERIGVGVGVVQRVSPRARAVDCNRTVRAGRITAVGERCIVVVGRCDRACRGGRGCVLCDSTRAVASCTRCVVGTGDGDGHGHRVGLGRGAVGHGDGEDLGRSIACVE